MDGVMEEFPKPFEDFWLEGLVPAVFTPFHENGELNLTMIDDYYEFFLKNNIKAIFVNGTTGEGQSMTLEERKKVVEKWIAVARGRLKIVVHVGGLNVKESIDLTKHAVNAGADAFASLPPLFFKPNTTGCLVEYCKTVADAAPNLPFYYYHLPYMTGVDFKMEDFLTMAKKRIPNLVGLKFASKDLGDMIGCLFAGKFNILCGSDEQLMANVVMGAHGAVGTLHNCMPLISQRLLQYLENGKMERARGQQILVQKVLRIMLKYGHTLGGNVAAVKAIMGFVGVHLGPPRQPMRGMTTDESVEFRKDMEKLGFMDWKPANVL